MGSYTSRRMSDENSAWAASDYDSDSSSDQDMTQNYSQILSLINRSEHLSGQVHILSQDNDKWRGPRLPRINIKPNTVLLDTSDFSYMTKKASGLVDDGFKEQNVASMLANREKGSYANDNFSYPKRCKISNRYLPNKISLLERGNGKVFCGIFSRDGNRFITASQDRSIRIYDSSTSAYKFSHSIKARDVGWSIIDVAFSPNREHFVYSTWSSALHLCSVDDNVDLQEPLSLLKSGRRFCVFSVVFASDGKELLGGANDGCLYIYNLQRHDRTLRIRAHEYDVNSVRFADDSSHIIYSGGDDGIIRVWDRRTLDESNPNAVGVLAGHMDGITFIDSRKDGRYLISNSKDQSIKLWDVRVLSGEKAAEKSLQAVHEQTWDYRWQEVPKKLYSSKNKLEGDTSIMTYQGHVVVKTLVRCRFSPLETTGQRYIYSGCGMGRVVIFDALTGKMEGANCAHKLCVRDVDWHPTRNEILSSSWDGSVGRWSFSDRDRLAEIEARELDRNQDTNSKRRSSRLAMKKKRQDSDS